MCGIVGGVGNIDLRTYLIEGLKKLDYRGYDSAGLSYVKDGKINVYKVAGRVSDLEAHTPPFSEALSGIAHTRWATHGQPNSINAHPHLSKNEHFAIVHNGGIENFRALKNQLKVRGYSFRSETDTEVIANMLERFYDRCGSDLESVRQTVEILEGSFACAIIASDHPNRLYFMKKASPLLIGVAEKATLLASDAYPMIGLTNRFLELEDGDYGFVEEHRAVVYHDGKRVERPLTERNVESFQHDLDGYPHYMLKEIEEIPGTMSALLNNYFDGESFTFNPELIAELRKAKSVHFLACGTSYYASMMGVGYMHYLGKQSTVTIASEWAYDPYSIDEKPFYILLSQSGETADLIRCQKIINDRGALCLAVTNTKGSTIERNATFSCLLYAGLEVAVASTKSYLSQTMFLALLTGAIQGRTKGVVHVQSLIDACRKIINRREEIHELAKQCKDAKDAFFVGRGFDYYGALEGALKLKEIAYVHAEAYPGGELKHGPIALIEENTLVIGFVSDAEKAPAIRNNLEELASRKAKIVVFSTEPLDRSTDAFIVPQLRPHLAAAALVMVAQYFSYYVALEKGCPIDKPRNLAKSVTVE